MLDKLRQLPDEFFSPLDIGFADFICRQAGKPANYPLFLAAALASNASVNRKYSCLDLRRLEGRSLLDWFADVQEQAADTDALLGELTIPQGLPELLEAKTAVVGRVVGGLAEFKPLLLDKDFLYLYRDWKCETKLAEMLKDRCGDSRDFDPAPLAGKITAASKLFEPMQNTPDWQQLAVLAAMRNRFTVISGGPGTGKTTVAAVAAALLLELRPGVAITLCAPTGKAKTRLEEALVAQLPLLTCSEATKTRAASLPVATIHRLLGSRSDSPRFRFNENRRLSMDVLIVDEASMISQALMKGLLSATPDNAKIIMLGDMEQLASVESGMVLRDFCLAAGSNSFSAGFVADAQTVFGALPELPVAEDQVEFADCVVELMDNHRFASDRGLGLTAAAIRAQKSGNEPQAIIDAIRQDVSGEIELHPLPEYGGRVFAHSLETHLRQLMVRPEEIPYPSYVEQEDFATAFALFNKFRILCAHRRGHYGAHNINRLLEETLNPAGAGQHFYPGKPLIITRNNPGLGLYNGDTGLVWPDENGKLKAFFPDLAAGGNRCFEFNSLPPFETAYAMTVHKAQGSGFQNVLIILPPVVSPVMKREMIYTAITRAEQRAVIWSEEAALSESLKFRTQRHSRLSERIMNADTGLPSKKQ